MQYRDKKGRVVSIGDTVSMMIEAETPVGKVSCYKRFTVSSDNIKYLVDNGYLKEDEEAEKSIHVDEFIHALEESLLISLSSKAHHKYPIIATLFSCSDTAAIKMIMEHFRYKLVSNKAFAESDDLVYAGVDMNKNFIVKPYEKVLPSDTVICLPTSYVRALRNLIEKFYEN